MKNPVPPSPAPYVRTLWPRRTRRIARLLGVAVAGALAAGSVAACHSEQQATVATDQAVGAQVDAARITVISPGEGPLESIRYHRERKGPSDYEMEIERGFDQQVAPANSAEAQAPKVADFAGQRETFRGKVNAQNDGTAGSTLIISSVDELSGQLSGPATALGLEGFQMGLSHTDQGQPTQVRFAAPTQAQDEDRQAAERLLGTVLSLPVVFPEEEIGVGAKWTVENRVTGGSTLLQTITYTLKERQGDSVTVGVAIEQRPSQSSLQAEDGTTLDVVGVESSAAEPGAAGTITVDLQAPLPTRADVAFVTQIAYGGQRPKGAPDTAANENRVTQQLLTRLHIAQD